MKTEYDYEYDALVLKNERTEGLIQARREKVQKIRDLIETYEVAIVKHEEYIAGREEKSAREKEALEGLDDLRGRLNDEIQKEADAGNRLVFDKKPVFEDAEEESRYVEDTVGTRVPNYTRDFFLTELWESRKVEFNKINLGRAGSKD